MALPTMVVRLLILSVDDCEHKNVDLHNSCHKSQDKTDTSTAIARVFLNISDSENTKHFSRKKNPLLKQFILFNAMQHLFQGVYQIFCRLWCFSQSSARTADRPRYRYIYLHPWQRNCCLFRHQRTVLTITARVMERNTWGQKNKKTGLPSDGFWSGTT